MNNKFDSEFYKYLRKLNNLTTVEVAEKIGTTQGAVSKLELGIVKTVSKNSFKLFNMYGIECNCIDDVLESKEYIEFLEEKSIKEYLELITDNLNNFQSERRTDKLKLIVDFINLLNNDLK